MVDRAFQEKRRRLAGGGAPRLLDLFAGAGGLSLGFATAGFQIIGAIEADPDAYATHEANFGRVDHGKAAGPADMCWPPQKALHHLGLAAKLDRAVDVLIGGPPCQAFARVGRAKLREEARRLGRSDAESAHVLDGRVNLYQRYLVYVKALKPLAILIENVPDILNHGGRNYGEDIARELAKLGYESRYTLLNSVFYGVPQMRERMFLLAYHRSLKASIRFPAPVRRWVLPGGYHGTRSVALKTLSLPLLGSVAGLHFVAPPEGASGLPQAVTAEQALRDLPNINAIAGLARGTLRRGPRRLDERLACRGPVSTYGRLMRNWPGFEGGGTVTAHVIRYLPRDYRIFREMTAGEQYPEALERAIELFRRRLLSLESKGQAPLEGSEEWLALNAAFVPPYDAGKFPNKWRKMEPDAPARTLMAHLGKDSYSHIHYDSKQARTISVREAARLQSFPDGFVLKGSMNPAFRQIGNAVPPLLAYAIAREVRTGLGLAQMPDIREAQAPKPRTRRRLRVS